MSHKYPLIAAAVAAALGSGLANAAPPTLAQAASSTATLVISGSSAAQSSIANAVGVDLCGGASNMLTVESAGGNKNFYAFSCALATSGVSGISAGTVVTIYYRSEGGSVTGALPIATGKPIKRLNLSDSSCTASGNTGSCTVNGVTATNGPNDSWTGAVVNDTVQLGVTDVEPAQLVGADYPSNYSASVFGSASVAQMAALPHSRAIQQVFGIAVNTQGLTLAPGAGGQVNLSRESVANILGLKYTDWSQVPDALTGKPVSSTPEAITRIDREPGSGTRTSANIYFLNYGCGSANAIANTSGETLNYSTGDELALANNTAGSIAYASIDNLVEPKSASYPNLVLATINGVTPTTTAAAAGEYDYWYEATLVPNPSVTSGPAAALSSYLQTNVPSLNSAPIAADVNVIPNVGGNSATVPLTGRSGDISSSTYTASIFINPYTRSGNSCNVPAETND